jgi:hypothetical protein
MEIIAHGGVGVKNTWGACQQAALLGLPIEIDVRLAADGTPILAHDPSRHGDDALWSTLPSSEGLTLQTALALPCPRFFVELKESAALVPSAEVVQASGLRSEQVAFISSDVDFLALRTESARSSTASGALSRGRLGRQKSERRSDRWWCCVAAGCSARSRRPPRPPASGRR